MAGSDSVLRDEDTVMQWVTGHRDAGQVSRDITATRELDSACARVDIIDRDPRCMLLDLVEQTARHAHIIRETLDGSRGL